ncbi:hypothetical protein K9M79_05525 [Candidatus Woesearchaeota archaeon]|nr:hypothetical protein [Candidatus Woesearchaeota archaeon]
MIKGQDLNSAVHKQSIPKGRSSFSGEKWSRDKRKWLGQTIFAVFACIAIGILFYSQFVPHYEVSIPLHVDSWITISVADSFSDNHRIMETEPFSNLEYNYPPGSYVFLSVLSDVTGINLADLSELLPGFFLVIIGCMLYLIFRHFYEKPVYSLLPTFFSLMILSNITILGPYYLVPISFGIIIYLSLLYFSLKDNIIMQIISFVMLVMFHRSTALLGAITLFISFTLGVFESRKIIPYLKKLIIIGLISLAGFFLYVASIGDSFFSQLWLKFNFFFNNYLIQSIERPFINYVSTLGVPVFIVIGLGMFAFINKPKWKLVLFTFFILVLSLFSFWNWGFSIFIPYRRLVIYLFLFSPLFFSAGLVVIYEYISSLVSEILPDNSNTKYVIPTLYIISLLIFVPFFYGMNYNSHASRHWVDQGEMVLFEEFGKKYPGESLVADHLESFAFPYFNITPVILSEYHPGDHKLFSQYYSAYVNRDLERLRNLFIENTDIKYIYFPGPVESQYLTEELRTGEKVIYRFDIS